MMRNRHFLSLLNDRLPERQRSGGIIVFLVIGVVMLLAMAMITVDVASMQLARTELRSPSDAAAKAGAEALLRTQSSDNAETAAISMAALNRVAGKSLLLNREDVIIGSSARQPDGSWTFTVGGEKPNAVRVNAELAAGSASGPVDLFFGKVFNSGTFEPAKTSTASVLQQEVCLAIDRSASMAYDLSGVDESYPPGGANNLPPHPSLSRWSALTHAMDTYLTIAAETSIPPRVALITWASNMTWEEPLTLLYDNIRNDIAVRSASPLVGRTNLALGLDNAVTLLSGFTVIPYAKRVIILLTDGQQNEGRSPLLSAQDARNSGIIIHVVTFLPEANTPDMTTVAQMTGGRHIHAETEAELVAAFEELARTLPVVLTD